MDFDEISQFEQAIRRLTQQHLELKDEPLYLALSYLPARRDQQHMRLNPHFNNSGRSALSQS